jgi:hypothetical protein
LETMYLLSEYDRHWIPIYDKSLDLLKKGMRPNGFLFDKYNVEEKRFYDEEKNLINHLMCAIHLSERGFSNLKLLNFLEREWEKRGKIFGRYDPETGKPIVDYESAAVYGLVMRLALLEEKKKFAAEIYKKILKFRAAKKKSLWYGSLCGEGCHGFDHLQILLSLMVNERGFDD